MQSFTSRVSRHIPIKLLVFAAFLGPGVVEGTAQPSEVRLKVKSLSAARLAIEVKGEPTRTWSFRNTHGNIVGLAERIQNVRGIDTQGQAVLLHRDAPGEFRSTENVSQIIYEVTLTRPSKVADLSRVSWLDNELGLLMLGDLIPQQRNSRVDLILELPESWTGASSSNPNKNGRYTVEAAEKAVFVVGKAVRQKKVRFGSKGFTFITVGAWPFNDSAALKVAEKLIAENTKILQSPLPADSALMLMTLPGVTTAGRWTAETRGSTVVLLMGTDARRNAALGRLQVVLAHELFHLWVPNALKLQGDYDWFFEGFTVYQALLTALRLRYIKFQDYLETLSRVYDSYRSSTERDKLSLLEGSERRWTTTSSVVYDRGVLVAFIYDLMRRRQSGTSESVSSIYPEVWQTASEQDGNEILMAILNRHGMEGFSERFVESASEIDLESLLLPYGLELQTVGSRSQLRVSNTITSEQHRLLKTLGYKGKS